MLKKEVCKTGNSINLQSLMLNVEGIVPNFQSDIYNYDLTVSNETEDIDVQAIAENQNAKVEISGNKNLDEGLNTIKIVVIYKEKVQEYTIKVTKTSDFELANTNLENLAIEYTILAPEFNNQIVQYNTQVSNTIDRLNILAIPENEQGKVEILGNDTLKEGNNKVIITVTAPNGFTQRIYEVNVYKRNKQEEDIYNQEIAKLQEKLDEAYSVSKTVNEEKEEKIVNTSIGKICFLIVIVLIVIVVKVSKKRCPF